MMPILRKKRVRLLIYIVLGCYCVFLLALVWTPKEKNLADGPDRLGVSQTHHHHQENGSEQKGTKILGEEPPAAFRPDGPQHEPGMLPVRRKLSRPDLQQMNVVVEDALPDTFSQQEDPDPDPQTPAGSSEGRPQPQTPLDKRDPARNNKRRVSDPRALDKLIAGAPEEEEDNDDDPGQREKNSSTTEDRGGRGGGGGGEGGGGDDPSPHQRKKTQDEERKREDSGFRDLNPLEENASEEGKGGKALGVWIAPDGAVENLGGGGGGGGGETNAGVVPSSSEKDGPQPQQKQQQQQQKQQQHHHHQQQQRMAKENPREDSGRSADPLHPRAAPAMTSSSPSPSSSTSWSSWSLSSPQFPPAVDRRTAGFAEIADLALYSAFHDGRARASPPLVRVLGVGPAVRRPPVARLWCVFPRAPADPAPVSVLPTGDCRRRPRRRGEEEEEEGGVKRYCFYMLRCQIPERFQKLNGTAVDSVVLVSRDATRDPVDPRRQGERVRLHVICNARAATRGRGNDVRPASGSGPGTITATTNTNTTTTAQTSTFAVCVPPLFGKITALQIVEFVEVNRLLGAGHFVFYAFRVSREVSRVLSFYEEAGLVTALPWNVPAPNDLRNKGEGLAAADCLYRTMHVLDFAVFSAVNELLVPARGVSWQALVETLSSEAEGAGRVAAYEVLPVKLYPDPKLGSSSSSFSRTKSEAYKFLTLRNTWRGKPPPPLLGSNDTTRLVVRPDRVVEVEPRSLARPVPGEGFESRKVAPGVAVVYRFTAKACTGLSSGPEARSCEELREDRTVWRYKDALVQRTKYVLRMLNRQPDSRLT